MKKTENISKASSRLLKWAFHAVVVLFIVLTAATTSYSQNGVRIAATSGTADPSAMLEVLSVTKGFLAPRMTAAQRGAIGSPATGLMVYQTDGADGCYYYDGASWIRISTTTGTVTGVTASSPLFSTGGANPDISLTGIVGVANGGSGAGSLTGYLVGNGAAPFTGTATIPASDLSGTVSNAQLANSSVTVNAGTGLTGGGTVALGGSTTIDMGNTAVAPGAYGSSTSVGTFTVDAQGRLTSASNTAIDANSLGALTTASNGLTEVSNDVRLGGTLTGATTIAQAGFDFGFTGSGSVGIGTAAPANKLDVVGAVKASAGFKSAGGTVSVPDYRFDAEASTGMWRAGAGLLAFSSLGTEKMRITGTGLGVGTTAPAATLSIGTGSTNKLNIAGADGEVTFTDPLGSITFPATAGANSPMIQMFASGTTNVDRMVIAHSPGFTNYGLQYQDATDKFNFLSAGTNVMAVDLTTQRVGIGVAAPAQKLDVAGNVQFTGALMPAANAGISGQVLTSAGAGVAPTWSGLGQDIVEVVGTGSLTVTSATTTPTVIPGLTTTVSIPANSKVFIFASGGSSNTSGLVNGWASADVQIYVDGVQVFTPAYRRAIAANTIVSMIANWSLNKVLTLTAGTHTIDIRASFSGQSAAGVNSTISGASGSVLQGVLSVQVAKL